LGKLREQNRLDCPTCREPFGEGKSLLAFAIAVEVQPCRHQDCTETTPLDKIVQHEKECKWRLIICPGVNCGTMIPFCKVEDHAQECHECFMLPDKFPERGLIFYQEFSGDEDDDRAGWLTKILNFEGKLFFCRMFTGNNILTVDVAMKGSLEECAGYLIEASVLDSNSVKPTVQRSTVKSSFPPRPLREDNKPGFCLTVPLNLMSKVWKLDGNDFNVEIGIKIVSLE